MIQTTHSGWKAIAKRLGIRSTATARRWVKKSGVPVLIVGHTAVLDEAVYLAWYRENINLNLMSKIVPKSVHNRV